MLPKRELLLLSEVAQFCRVTPRTVRRWIAIGMLPSIKLLRGVRVRREDLERLVHGAGGPPARSGPDD